MKQALVIALSLVLVQGVCHADLGDFKESFEEAEQGDAERDQSRQQETPDTDDSDDEPDIWAELFKAIFGFLFEINTHVTYNDFPYSGQEGPKADFAVYPEGTIDETIYPAHTRNHWYALSATGSLLEDAGTLAQVHLTGRFWRLFGPEIHLGGMWDGITQLGTARLGLNMALIQTDPFTLEFFIQYQRWTELLERDSLITGARIRSMPFRPIVVEASVAAMIFDKTSIVEVEGNLQALLSRWYLFGGWKAWFGSRDFWQGPQFGLGVYL